MPLGPADDKGTLLYYEDTGVPDESPTYLTLFLVHGALFHGAVFRRMFPFAATHNLRIITVNKRGYVGSTPFTSKELDALRGPVEQQREAVEALGIQLAHFIAWFIEKEKIPPTSRLAEGNGARTGGFALVGWSVGNIVTFSLMANADKLPEQTRRLFELYFSAFIVYDMPIRASGDPFEHLIYSPWRDPSLSEESRIKAFGSWISTYCLPLVSLTGDAATIAARKPLLENGSNRPVTTVARMTPDELASTTDMAAFEHSQMLVLGVNPIILRDNVQRTLIDARFDVDSGGKKVLWPALQVKAVWCDMTIGDVVLWHFRLLQRWKTEQQLGHGGARPFEVFRFEKANHFPHWDDAERFTEFMARILR
ncbi:hypothetical protein OBBRIDRAFT_779689 [Obba rivulosa]|uniref:AB hydrolase-1 domain-containing protein n=1 Tax=Obba rivulosa TaxID=1052685 RepID=A0A8E2DHX0_9APHY|nr:hypothetical protein OBBRIDRAFT_779689 [Obba rivulosa]